MHNYIFKPTREPWPAASVNARIPPTPTGRLDDNGKPIYISASLWLDQNRPVEQMTWAPGEPILVAWSDLSKDNFSPDYWNKVWRFYDNGGDADVAAYLASLDISSFDPKTPPPKTEAFWAIVDANRAPEDAELADVLDKLGRTSPYNPQEIILPDAVALSRVQSHAPDDFWRRRACREGASDDQPTDAASPC